MTFELLEESLAAGNEAITTYCIWDSITNLCNYKPFLAMKLLLRIAFGTPSQTSATIITLVP
jgi:hypothetical protein